MDVLDGGGSNSQSFGGGSVIDSSDEIVPPPKTKFLVGDVVWFNNGLAVVKFAGKTEFSSETQLGLDVGNKTGENDGSVNGVHYFEAEEKQGVFVDASKVKKKIYADELLQKLADEDRTHRLKIEKIMKVMDQLEEKNHYLRNRVEKRRQMEAEEEAAVEDLVSEIMSADPCAGRGGAEIHSDAETEKPFRINVAKQDASEDLDPEASESIYDDKSPRPDVLDGNPCFSPRPDLKSHVQDVYDDSPRPDIKDNNPIFSPRPS